MRKIIFMMSASVDGFMEGHDHDISWHLVDDELHSHFNAELGAMGGFLHGRVTYELMAKFWPTADADPASPEPVKQFARIWRDMPKVVYSRTLQRADWNTTVVHEVEPQEITKLTAQPGGDLVIGGASLAASFLRYDLIDEYRIYVHPVLIGGGKPMFGSRESRIGLRLAESRIFGNGVVLLRYQRPA
jgi:dihydrofolate reductase